MNRMHIRWSSRCPSWTCDTEIKSICWPFLLMQQTAEIRALGNHMSCLRELPQQQSRGEEVLLPVNVNHLEVCRLEESLWLFPFFFQRVERMFFVFFLFKCQMNIKWQRKACGNSQSETVPDQWNKKEQIKAKFKAAVSLWTAVDIAWRKYIHGINIATSAQKNNHSETRTTHKQTDSDG